MVLSRIVKLTAITKHCINFCGVNHLILFYSFTILQFSYVTLLPEVLFHKFFMKREGNVSVKT